MEAIVQRKTDSILNDIGRTETAIVLPRSGLSRLLRGRETEAEERDRIASNDMKLKDLDGLFAELLAKKSGALEYVRAHKDNIVMHVKDLYGIDVAGDFNGMDVETYAIPGGLPGAGGFFYTDVLYTEKNREISERIVQRIRDACSKAGR